MQRARISALSPAALTLLLLAAPAAAQAGVEGFEAGNPDGWEIWFSNYNSVQPTGGNPGAHLRLDNLGGPLTCNFLDIFPDYQNSAVPLAQAGDWRAVDVTEVSIDLDIQSGRFGGDLTLTLISDPGTPANTGDDCSVSFTLVGAGAAGPGWQTYAFAVPAAQMTAPAGWVAGSGTACAGFPLDQTWNTVIADVDQIQFTYDGLPGTFCAFTAWDFRVDNIRVATPTSSAPGTNYCTAVANSTGAAAAMSAIGSASVAANDLTLQCGDMPANAFAFFLTSRDQGLVMNPGGSQGNLCLGGAIGRFVGAGQIQNSGAGGQVALALDLALQPTPTGLVAVAPGETWHFTCWFRDAVAGSATSNFADGYTVIFQ